MESWRALDTHNEGVETYNGADLHHFDEKQDPDPDPYLRGEFGSGSL